jgi:HNH endonuclease
MPHYFNRRRANTYIDEDGYKRFLDSDIPFHRWMAEKKLGRKLRPGEVVHHKDRNKLNNNQDNLWVFQNQTQHYNAHLKDAKRLGFRFSFFGRRNHD